MSVVSSNAKSYLTKTYCCSWYGCQTWYLVSGPVTQMDVEWRKAVRRVLNMPYQTRSQLLPLLVKGRLFTSQHQSRVNKFISTFLTYENNHAKFIGDRARRSTAGALGRNFVRWLHTTDVHLIDAELLTRAHAIRELIDTRDGVNFIPGFNSDEIQQTIYDLFCEIKCFITDVFAM